MPRGRRRKRRVQEIVTEEQAMARFEGLAGSLVRKGIIDEGDVSAAMAESQTYREALSLLIRIANGKIASRGKATQR